MIAAEIDMDQDGRDSSTSLNALTLTSTQNTDLLWETQTWDLRVFDDSVRRFWHIYNTKFVRISM